MKKQWSDVFEYLIQLWQQVVLMHQKLKNVGLGSDKAFGVAGMADFYCLHQVPLTRCWLGPGLSGPGPTGSNLLNMDFFSWCLISKHRVDFNLLLSYLNSKLNSFAGPVLNLKFRVLSKT